MKTTTVKIEILVNEAFIAGEPGCLADAHGIRESSTGTSTEGAFHAVAEALCELGFRYNFTSGRWTRYITETRYPINGGQGTERTHRELAEIEIEAL